MSQPFYDHFALANKTIQERLGSASNQLNKMSAVYSMQARSLLQMLSYGLDSITARAASHLLNMDPLHANDAYLMKLCEGLLLNSIDSITPPMIVSPAGLLVETELAYARFATVGTVTLLDSSSANLVIYEDPETQTASTANLNKYKLRYCAGEYIKQSVSIESLDFTLGTLQSVYVSETYKSIWTPSVKITFRGLEGVVPTPVWSMTELLSYRDTGSLVFCQHTSRGLTLVLGDGELFGADYAGSDSLRQITSIDVEYIKMENLSNPDNKTISFNNDLNIIGTVPVLAKLSTGDTAETLRSRSIQELFANGKVTDEKDLEVEISRIPIVKSCSARREFDKFPIAAWDSTTQYPKGAMVLYNNALWIQAQADMSTAVPTEANWLIVCPASNYAALVASGVLASSAFRYDNATIMLSGLMVANRTYYSSTKSYTAGDIVYYQSSGSLYRCISSVEAGVLPDSDEGAAYWMSEADLNATSTSDPYHAYIIEGYEPITQSSYELELKTYFGIYQRLGFTSVVVEPVVAWHCSVTCSYAAPYDVSQSIYDTIVQYACYCVGKHLLASELHSQLTEKFNLTKVYITISSSDEATAAATGSVSLPTNAYVPRTNLIVTLTEVS